MSTELKAGSRVCIRYMVQSYEPYGHYRDRALMSSQRKPERQLQRRGSYEWSNVLARLLSFHSQFILTCCDIQRATSSPTRAKILDRWRITLGIGIYNRRPDTLRSRLIGLRSSGGISVWGEPLEARRTLSDFQGPSGLSLPTGTAPNIL